METANIVSTEKNIVSLALADIQPSTYNPRKRFDEAALAELAANIRQQGILQPIGVRPVADTGRFEIIFGERRYRASLMAEQAEIPAIVLDASDEEAQEMAVTENLQREDVSPMEEANAYQRLIESGRHDVPSLAVQFGKSENYIRTRLKFLSLIPEIAELLEADELTVGVGGCNLPLRRRHPARRVRQSSERGSARAQQLARSESLRRGEEHRAAVHDRPRPLPVRQDPLHVVSPQHQ